MSSNAKKRADIVRKIVETHYEQGRQDKCKLWVFRNIVRKEFPVSERTFWRYLKEENRTAGHEDGPVREKE